MRFLPTLLLSLVCTSCGQLSSEAQSAPPTQYSAPDPADADPGLTASDANSGVLSDAPSSAPDATLAGGGADAAHDAGHTEPATDATLAADAANDAALPDAAADAAASPSCTAAWDGGHACSDLLDIGPQVLTTCSAAPLPTGTGGPILDGTYVLTSRVQFGTACIDGGTYDAGTPGNPLESLTILIASGCLQAAGHIDGSPNWQTGSFTVSGADLIATVECALPELPQTIGYTTDGATLTLFEGAPSTLVQVFTRQ
jgi:hypothetical protein